jgi:hypothetical protein
MTTPLDTLQADLARLRSGELRVQAFSDQARRQEALLEQLPPKFREVLFDLLDRLESSALFAEESCSFSQSGLLDNLQLWIDKARQRLSRE